MLGKNSREAFLRENFVFQVACTLIACLWDGVLGPSGLGFEEEQQPGHRRFNYRPRLGTSMETHRGHTRTL